MVALQKEHPRSRVSLKHVLLALNKNIILKQKPQYAAMNSTGRTESPQTSLEPPHPSAVLPGASLPESGEEPRFGAQVLVPSIAATLLGHGFR